MATIFNNIERVAGAAESALVTITLMWDTTVSPVAKVEDEDAMIQGSYGTSTDLDGNWSVALTANDDITPVDSVYKITERITQGNATTTYYVSVPNNATPTFWVGDILVDEPAWAV